MTENSNPARYNHRIRTRQATSRPPDWELLQTLLGLAFTIQQEPPQPKSQAAATMTYGQHPALERIAAFARNLTEASGAAIALGDSSGMLCVARSGASAPPVGAEFNASDGLSGECIRLAQPVICVNAAADPRVNYQACRALNVASLLYLPLYSTQRNVIGVLGVFSPQPLHFSQRDISSLLPTERLVQEALGSTAENPDPATLGVLLRQARIESAENVEATEQKDAATDFDIALMRMPFAAQPKVAIPAAPVVVPERTPELRTPEASAIFVGRVVDESAVESEPEVTEKPPSDEESEGRSRFPAMLVAIVMLLAITAAYNYKRSGLRAQPQAKVNETKTAAPIANVVTAPAPAEAAVRKLTDAVSMTPSESGAVINIELPKAIRYEGYQLDHPDRIYFDLHDVKLSDDQGGEFKQADGVVSGIRLFTYGNGVTRIVFDLRHPASFAAELGENPPRLRITIKTMDPNKISEADPQTKPGLHTGSNSP